MTRAERRALLGDTVIARIRQLAADAPAPEPQLVDELRRILTCPAAASAPVVERSAA